MKVTKAKGLNTIRMNCFGKRVRPAMDCSVQRIARPKRRANALALRPGRIRVSSETKVRQPHRLAEAIHSDRIQALCFGDFHLGQQMKVTGHAGPVPGAVPRAAETTANDHV
ncbi:MAG: hypothetical protein M3Z29_11500 [Pseudomonadota bacterium]|nr:hypothetical protein [Pseudomonadota bacterium]